MKRLVRVAAVALLAAGCAKGAMTAQTATGYHAADYQPLAVGNQWTYTGKMLGQPIENTVTIKEVRDGYFVDDNKGMLKATPTGIRDDKRYLLTDPIEVGRTWTSIVSVSSTERYEIADAGFTVTTPAGVFKDCVQVRGVNRIDRDKEMRAEWTYAPGVGLVRMSTAIRIHGKDIPQTSFELKSFKLATPAAATP